MISTVLSAVVVVVVVVVSVETSSHARLPLLLASLSLSLPFCLLHCQVDRISEVCVDREEAPP